jgi:hypothetical protein
VCGTEKENVYRILIGKYEGKGPLERCRHKGKMIIKWIIKYGGKICTGFIGLKIGAIGRLL